MCRERPGGRRLRFTSQEFGGTVEDLRQHCANSTPLGPTAPCLDHNYKAARKSFEAGRRVGEWEFVCRVELLGLWAEPEWLSCERSF